MIKRIVQIPNKILYTPCSEVTKFNDRLRKHIQNMTDTMKAHRGLGISANQIGIPKQICIIQAPQKALLVFINPKIVSHTDALIDSIEACLSISQGRLAGTLKRHEQITIEYQDLNGEKRKGVCYEEEARIFLHEYDHLLGIVFTDKATRVWKI